MEYRVTIQDFDGPLDLLLHLVKQMDISIYDISIELITKQYFDYINIMEELNLNVASEYLVMAAELLEIKSSMLLPKHDKSSDDYEEDPKEQLINRLLEYEKYKSVTVLFKECEEERKCLYSKLPNRLDDFCCLENSIDDLFDINDLVNAFRNLLSKKELDKPLSTRIANREYSVSERCIEIKMILQDKKKVDFKELLDVYSKDYLAVTFLSILDLAKKHSLVIVQDRNFDKIFLEAIEE